LYKYFFIRKISYIFAKEITTKLFCKSYQNEKCIKIYRVAGNVTLVQTTNNLKSSLYQVKDVVLNETKYFEKEENAYAYAYENNLINPNTSKSYKRILGLSSGLKTSNRKTSVKTEELKLS
jgi:hypothetical protein